MRVLPKPFRFDEDFFEINRVHVDVYLGIYKMKIHRPVMGIPTRDPGRFDQRRVYIHFLSEYKRLILLECPLPFIVGIYRPVTLGELATLVLPAPEEKT